MKIALISMVIASVFLTGCTANRIKGGSVDYSAATGSKTVLKQSDDPKEGSSIKGESEKGFEMFIPKGSVVNIGSLTQSEAPKASKAISSPKTANVDSRPSIAVEPTTSIVLSSNAFIRSFAKDKMQTENGAAQKNMLAEVGAKLSSMRPVQFVGIALLLFGLASMFWLPLRAVVGSHTTSLVIAATGLGLIVLPILIVGNEVLILFIGLGCAAGYFFVYRYSQASTKAKVYKDFIDLNKNSIDDRLEKTEEKVETPPEKV